MIVLLVALAVWLVVGGLWLTTNLLARGTFTALTTSGIAGLATSSSWTTGYETSIIDLTGGETDCAISGKITVGTTPTINTQIRIYLIPSWDDGVTWDDVFDGTASAETVTSAGVRDGFAVLGRSIGVDAATSDRPYPFNIPSVMAMFNGNLPSKLVCFVAHNTVAALNATPANQVINARTSKTTNG